MSSPVVGEEDGVVGQGRWEEPKRLRAGGMTVSGISRATGLDRKTVRRCLRQVRWRAYRGAPRRESLPITLFLYLIECPFLDMVTCCVQNKSHLDVEEFYVLSILD